MLSGSSWAGMPVEAVESQAATPQVATPQVAVSQVSKSQISMSPVAMSPRGPIPNADQGHVEVAVSATEQNRLAVRGRKIAHVVASRRGQLSVVKDEIRGVLYFALAEDSNLASSTLGGENDTKISAAKTKGSKTGGTTRATTTLFVTDERGISYKLILKPSAIAGADIVLLPPKGGADGYLPQARAELNGRAPSYQRRVKSLMLMLGQPQEALENAGVDVYWMNKVVPLWREAQLVLIARMKEGQMLGEQYRLRNVSPSLMRLVEQEFYRDGVIAVSVAEHVLRPGESTTVSVIRARSDDDD